MKYTVYKITNIINQKTYIGAHKTDFLDDDYYGSGHLIRRAIKKHGIKNFKKEILAVFDNEKDMFELEKKLVNEDFIQRKDTYNISIGGNGGNKLPKGHFTQDKDYLRSISPFHEGSPYYGTVKNGHKAANRRYLELCEEHGGRWYDTPAFTGKKHTEETKRKMSASHKGKHDGKKNSQYGTCWIYSDVEQRSAKIKRDELDKYIKSGWKKGRKVVF